MRPSPTSRRSAATLVAVATFGLAACGSSKSSSPVETRPTDKGGVSVSSASRASGDGTVKTGASTTVAAASSTAAPAATTAKPTAPDGDAGNPVTTVAAPPSQQAPLKAGSVDDNAKFDDYLAYRSKLASRGVNTRNLDPTGRIVVKVVNGQGRALSGTAVKVTRGQETITTLTATADGTVRFFPSPFGGPANYGFTVGNTTVTAEQGSVATLTVTAAPSPSGNAVDIVFAVDATGSMGDEIARLKSSIDSVASRISNLPGQPDLRIAMTTFRDEGDTYVTQNTDFTSDIGSFRAQLARVQAGGGGDIPEALDEALDDSLAAHSWRPAGSAIQMVFLVGDAGPHVERQVRRGYNETAMDANARGIKIFPVASSNSDDLAEAVFRQVAQYTGARFVFLSYGAAGAGPSTGESTNIDTSDYEELSLDDLIVRLVAEEVGARNGIVTA
jgi:Mg-chelatase subunit ChlD